MRVVKVKTAQSGFMLVAVLFLMLVVALLLVFLLRTGTETYVGGVLRIQQARAYQAAQAGLEWGLFNVGAGACPGVPTTTTLNLSEEDLSGFTVQVTISCDNSTYTEGASTITIIEIDSTASMGTYGTSHDFVSQQVSISVEGP